ncbi:hypothetical protein C0991_002250 [Blastosporella zonata]|nr:hypothetical protein C0991_002250 [Blastosporella zonata]
MDTRLCLKWLVYTLLGLIADAIAFVLVAFKPDKTPDISIRASAIDDLTDEQIREMTKAASRVGISNVVLLDINIVIKLSEDNDPGNVREVLVQELLFAKTTIPIARIRRVLPYKGRVERRICP